MKDVVCTPVFLDANAPGELVSMLARAPIEAYFTSFIGLA